MVTTSYTWRAGATPLLQTNDMLAAGDQNQVAVASSASGNYFFAAWTDPTAGDSVEGRLLFADGDPIASQFTLNLPSAASQRDASVTGLLDGRYVVAFTDTSADPGGDIRVRLFNPNGSPVGNGFAAASLSTDESEADVAALHDGGFVVSWTRDFGAGDKDLAAAVYNADGSFRVGLPVNSSNVVDTHASSVAGLAGGGFVVAYQTSPVAGGSIETNFQLFNANGTKLYANNEILIDSYGSINKDIQVAGLPDGGFVVAYTDDGWGLSGTEITARVYNADGSARSGDLLVNDGANGGKTAGDQALPSLTVLSNGDFAVSWSSPATHLEYLQAYDAQGNALGPNKLVMGNVVEAEIAGLGGGQVAMAAESLVPDGSGTSIRSKIYELIRSVDGDATSEVIHATEDGLEETINGAGGDDTVVFSHNFSDYFVRDFGTKIVVAGSSEVHTLTSIEHLQFADGTITPDDGNLLFDTLYYLARNSDVYHAGVNALEHFNSFGWHEGRNPNQFFSVTGYLAANPDVAAANVNPLDHYHLSGWHEGRDPSANFDTTLYLLRNPDVAAAGVDPLAHFLQFGLAEGRGSFAAIGQNIVAGFDAEYYLLANPDVAAAHLDPWQHFNTVGWHEGRDPNAWFSTKGYLAHYADVAAANVNPLEHYEQFGWKEGRDPATYFDTLGYLAANPDVAAANVNPLDHFLQFGIYEGRANVNDGLWH
jgi:hypothetical protein